MIGIFLKDFEKKLYEQVLNKGMLLFEITSKTDMLASYKVDKLYLKINLFISLFLSSGICISGKSCWSKGRSICTLCELAGWKWQIRWSAGRYKFSSVVKFLFLLFSFSFSIFDCICNIFFHLNWKLQMEIQFSKYIFMPSIRM